MQVSIELRIIDRRIIDRKVVMAGLLAVVGACLIGPADVAAASGANQEFYELRIYRIENAHKQAIVSNYLEKALLPALGRLDIRRVGVFTVIEGEGEVDHSIFVLIPYPTLGALADLSLKLAEDSSYQESAKEYFAQPMDDPAYKRIESRLMKAFAGMPVVEMPTQTATGEPRIFELRIYESSDEDAAVRKVEMFNSSEIQIMRDVKMAPVFFGQTLIASDTPNLVYMLSADDMQAHQAHWKAFRSHPEWDRIKGLAKYKDTVSNITNWFLAPTSYSQL